MSKKKANYFCPNIIEKWIEYMYNIINSQRKSKSGVGINENK